MRDYSKVSPALWQSERFNSLPSDDGRYLYLYLLTNEHQTSAGCYRIPDGYACSDLRWPLERYIKALAELVDADLVLHDKDAHVIGIRRWFRHNPPVSESHLLGVERVLERLSSQSIAEAAKKDAQESWEAFEAAKAMKASRKQKPAHGLPTGLGAATATRFETRYMAGKT
jgi:hypothetical protein